MDRVPGNRVPKLQMTVEVQRRVVAHSLAMAPIEACGLLAGYDRRVVAFHPVTNVAASSRLFRLDGAEMLIAEQAAEGAGHEIIGVMHSHTSTPAWPSATDQADAARFDPLGAFHHLIVSTVSDPPDVRAFLLRGLGDGEVAGRAEVKVTEVEVDVIDADKKRGKLL